jgi:hypothetical protein
LLLLLYLVQFAMILQPFIGAIQGSNVYNLQTSLLAGDP